MSRVLIAHSTPPGQGNGIVGFEQRALVFRDEGDPFAALDAQRVQEMREAVDTLEHLRIGAPHVTVDHRDFFAINRGGPR